MNAGGRSRGLVGRRAEPGPIAGDKVALKPDAAGHEQDDDDHNGDQATVTGAFNRALRSTSGSSRRSKSSCQRRSKA